MPVIPLKQLSYDDANDMRRIIDAINSNFRYLDWLINHGNLDTVNIEPELLQASVPVGGDTYLEYGMADWNVAGVEFILVNGYLEMPVATTSVQGDPAEFDTASFVLVIKHIQETIGEQLCYSKVQIYPKGSSVPTLTGAKITMQAVCRGGVAKQ